MAGASASYIRQSASPEAFSAIIRRMATVPVTTTGAPATTATAAPPRLASLDAYRGFVMFLMMAEVLRLAAVAARLPGNAFWGFLAFHQTHAPWAGCSLHDLIQPSFSFMVGVAVPYSMASRLAKGQTKGWMTLHAFWRAFSQSLAASKPVQIQKDVWTTSISISITSYEAIPMIGKAARVAYLTEDGKLKEFDADAFFGYKDRVFDTQSTVLELKALQMAKATRWIETVLLQAWRDAHPNEPAAEPIP